MAYCCSQCNFTAKFESALMMHRQLHHDASPESPQLVKLQSLTGKSDGTSNARRAESIVKSNFTCLDDQKESYACHLCNFDADRITVLDRHLLNDHKIGLESLLKLVMAKTKLGLTDEQSAASFGIRQPYYTPENEMIEEGEFIIETVTPKIKILKHASTNTEQLGIENFKTIASEIENLLSRERVDNGDLMDKMQTLNDYMCKFVTSSNALKKVLDSKVSDKDHEAFFNMGLGGNTPRDWEKAHSEKMERNRNKYQDSARGEKPKTPSDSFYF